MKRNALAVVSAAFLLSAVAMAAKPPATPTLTPLAWYDANGKLVGRSANYPWLAMPWGDDLVPVQLGPSNLSLGGAEFSAGAAGLVFFSLPDCTGTAYFNDTQRPLLGYRRVAGAVIQPDGMILYVTPRNPAPVQRAIHSYTSGAGDCTNIGGAPVVAQVLDTEGSMNLSGQFAVPLYLK